VEDYGVSKLVASSLISEHEADTITLLSLLDDNPSPLHQLFYERKELPQLFILLRENRLMKSVGEVQERLSHLGSLRGHWTAGLIQFLQFLDGLCISFLRRHKQQYSCLIAVRRDPVPVQVMIGKGYRSLRVSALNGRP
jgi:hypothetical protein